VEEIVGELKMPFQVSRKQIQERASVMLVFDPQMVNADYMKMQIELIGLLLPFNQGGTANMNELFRAGMEMVNADLADRVIDNDEVATEREVRDELDAISRAMNGLESPLPKQANHRLRLRTLVEQTIHSQNPRMMKRLAENPDALEILTKREEYHRNMIQQYQENPAIGRDALTTRPFSKEAPAMQAE
jgi:hypothetical protein